MPEISLTEGLYRELNVIAVDTGKSVTELVDECLRYAVALRFGMHNIDKRVSK